MFVSKLLSKVAPLKPVFNQSSIFSNALKPGFKQVRNLSIHEYQSQQLMREYGVRTPAGSVAATPDEAEKIAEALASQDLIIKAQILAGGRGLGTFDSGLKGGIHNCHSPKEVRYFAEKMLGHKLITKQTGQGGKVVSKVLVARRYYIRREAYFGILLDRQFQGPVMIGSSKGGVEIEKVAHEHPDAIIKEPIDIQKGLTHHQTEKMAHALGFQGEQAKDVQVQMNGLWKIFKERDATLVEVNPLIETNQGEVYCLDAKFNFDDNASFRQRELFENRDLTQMDKRDVEALTHDITYIGLDGNIGCLVNGAGLAMATMDIIKLYGGDPANFLDIGGGASQEQVTAAIRILNNDPKVKVILINIFGGIMRCDIIALGLIQAVKELSLKIPLVVRLEGTNLEAAKRILNDSGLRVMTGDDLDDAAQKAVKAAQIIELASQAKLQISFELPL